MPQIAISSYVKAYILCSREPEKRPLEEGQIPRRLGEFWGGLWEVFVASPVCC